MASHKHFTQTSSICLRRPQWMTAQNSCGVLAGKMPMRKMSVLTEKPKATQISSSMAVQSSSANWKRK